ncbi:hypothetical protein [Kribbella sp. NPDC006257]|uniref:hypothetical protein n=1 Tax=Kribbella sp. NPDC006257 TaxID=3156738 RepID=UPI0033BF3386
MRRLVAAGLSLGLLAAVAACGDSKDAVAPTPGAQGTPGPTGTPIILGDPETPITPDDSETPGTPTGTPGSNDTPGESGTPGAGGLPAACIPQSSLAICLTFDFKGSTTLKGSNWAFAGVDDPGLPDSTCAEYGASILKSKQVGLKHLSKVIGSHLIEAQFDTAWPPARSGIVDYPATGSIRIDDVAYEARNSNTTGMLELQPNGSGKYTLNKLVHTGGGDTNGTGSISGTITWTCMEPKN